jgi:hypothetical protein
MAEILILIKANLKSLMLAPSTETGEHEIKLEEDADDLMKIMKMTTKSHDFIVIICFLTSKNL